MVEPLQSSKLLEHIQGLASASDRAAALDTARFYRGSRIGREFIPMVITTDYQISLSSAENKQNSDGTLKPIPAPTYLLFWSGPKNTTWTFNQRGTMQQSRSGHIAHFWRDSRRDTFFDNPSVSFTFQTGNLLPIRNSVTGAKSLPPGLVDYYDFFHLMDERKILSSGRPNYVNIIYHSLLYPTILLRGFFEPETAISITESAGNPATVEWSATFRIKESEPSFYKSEKLREAWAAAITPSDYTVPQDILDDIYNLEGELQTLPSKLISEQLKSEELLLAQEQKEIQEAITNKQENRTLIDFIEDDFGIEE